MTIDLTKIPICPYCGSAPVIHQDGKAALVEWAHAGNCRLQHDEAMRDRLGRELAKAIYPERTEET